MKEAALLLPARRPSPFGCSSQPSTFPALFSTHFSGLAAIPVLQSGAHKITPAATTQRSTTCADLRRREIGAALRSVTRP